MENPGRAVTLQLLIDVSTEDIISNLTEYPSAISATAFDSKGGLLAVGYNDGRYKICDVSSGAILSERKNDLSYVSKFEFVGERLFIGYAKGLIKVIDLKTYKEFVILKYKKPTTLSNLPSPPTERRWRQFRRQQISIMEF